METTYTISDLSAHLFWDVDQSQVDWESDKDWLIQRILENGYLKDWKICMGVYGLATINAVSKNLRSINAVSLNFISKITNTPISKYRCYTERQLNPTLWNS